MQAIFAYSCGSGITESKDGVEIVDNLKEIDDFISQNAPKWPLDKINKVDLSILRTAIWELLHQPATPPKVVIDEAIEMAKEFGTESSAPFINGVLGSVIKNLNLTNLETNNG